MLLQKLSFFPTSKILCALSIIAFFNVHTFFAMDTQKRDDDSYEDIPLQFITQKELIACTEQPNPVVEQFYAFEKSLKKKYFGNNAKTTIFGLKACLTPQMYIKKAEKKIPNIMTNKKLIHQLQKNKSLLQQTTATYITIAINYYRNATSSTLKNIMNVYATGGTSALVELPPVFQKYIMKRAGKKIVTIFSDTNSTPPTNRPWKDCFNFLLCECAINNTTNKNDLKLVTYTQFFQSLNEDYKDDLMKKANQKAACLNAGWLSSLI